MFVVRLITNELRCIQEGCGRTWTSTYTWTIDNQIQDSKCKDCLIDVMPYKIVGTGDRTLWPGQYFSIFKMPDGRTPRGRSSRESVP